MLLMLAWVWCLMLLMLAPDAADSGLGVVPDTMCDKRESYWNHCAGHAATCLPVYG